MNENLLYNLVRQLTDIHLEEFLGVVFIRHLHNSQALCTKPAHLGSLQQHTP